MTLAPRVALILTLIALPLSVRADDRKPSDEVSPRVRETQLSVSLEQKGRRSRFRATIVGKEPGVITVLTAAHCIAPSDEGAPITLARGEKLVGGRVERVVRNPYYRPAPSPDIPGADNAVVRFRLDADGTLPEEELKPAELAGWAVLDAAGGATVIQSVDQFEAGHVLKAGNYSNPRWLEWGPRYRPVPGDSGGGVFVERAANDGGRVLYLIGAVVDRSDRGGGASLVSLKDRWLVAALKPREPRRAAAR